MLTMQPQKIKACLSLEFIFLPYPVYLIYIKYLTGNVITGLVSSLGIPINFLFGSSYTTKYHAECQQASNENQNQALQNCLLDKYVAWATKNFIGQNPV